MQKDHTTPGGIVHMVTNGAEQCDSQVGILQSHSFCRHCPCRRNGCELLLLSRFSWSDSVRPHRRWPTRLPCPWDSPGKNTGVGCHFLLQCMKVKSQSEVVQLCPTLCDPMVCSLPGSSVHGIFQAKVLEWGAIAFSMVVRVGHNSKDSVGITN